MRAIFIICGVMICSVAMGQPSPVSLTFLPNTKTLVAGQQAVVAVVMDIREGFHAQSHRPLSKDFIATVVTFKPDGNIVAHEPIYPEGVIETYPQLGRLSVYSGRVIVYVPIEVKRDAKNGPITLAAELTYQVCNDKFCFPPETVELKYPTNIGAGVRGTELNDPEIFRGFDFSKFAELSKPAKKQSGVKIFGRELGEGVLFPFAAAFLVGIIFNIMPCVLPVVPLKAIGFYEVSQHNRGLSLAFGAVFSLGLIATFAVLGLFVVVLRWLNWGELFANPYFLAGIVVILGVMGLSMFGVFTVGLP